MIAFRRAILNGYGVEVDVRDNHNQLVVSHGPPKTKALPFKKVLELWSRHGSNLTLAINIKADGLQQLLQKALKTYRNMNYLVFDMSFPDMIHFLKRRMRVYSRISDYEEIPLLYNKAQGIWLDAFHSTWFRSRDILKHLRNGKDVCLVSPELHGRDPLSAWRELKKTMRKRHKGRLGLCTDLPHKARRFFE